MLNENTSCCTRSCLVIVVGCSSDSGKANIFQCYLLWCVHINFWWPQYQVLASLLLLYSSFSFTVSSYFLVAFLYSPIIILPFPSILYYYSVVFFFFSIILLKYIQLQRATIFSSLLPSLSCALVASSSLWSKTRLFAIHHRLRSFT